VIRNSDYRDLAIFTIVQDEPEYIHPWINHYKMHVADAADIFVLIHAPMRSDGTPMEAAEIPGWQRAEALLKPHHRVMTLPVHHMATFDHQWLSNTVFQFQSFLLQSYDWVLFTEVDEFVLPTPATSSVRESLLDYIRDFGVDAPLAVRATGFEVVQQEDEPPIPPDRYNTGGNVGLTAGNMLDARCWWRPSKVYSKTLLSRIPLRWAAGFHSVEGIGSDIAAGPSSDKLTLVHLHKVDFELALSRRRRILSRRWSQIDIDERWGWQNRIGTAVELHKFWELDIDTGRPAEPGQLRRIPSSIKQSLG
jgi:hypothetical protein